MHKLLSNISLIIALIISLNSIGQVNDTTLIKVVSDSNNYESIIPDSLSTSPTIQNSNNVFDRTKPKTLSPKNSNFSLLFLLSKLLCIKLCFSRLIFLNLTLILF